MVLIIGVEIELAQRNNKQSMNDMKLWVDDERKHLEKSKTHNNLMNSNRIGEEQKEIN